MDKKMRDLKVPLALLNTLLTTPNIDWMRAKRTGFLTLLYAILIWENDFVIEGDTNTAVVTINPIIRARYWMNLSLFC